MAASTPSMSVTLTLVPPSTRSRATALARWVLPVPTGPQMYAPRPCSTFAAMSPAMGESAAMKRGLMPARS